MPRSRLLAWTLAVALVLLVPLTAIGGGVHLDLAPEAWGLAPYVGVVASGLAYWLLQVGFQSSSVTVASVVTLLEPTVAGLPAWLLLGESMTALQLDGAALMLGSVLLLTWPTAEADLPLVRMEDAGAVSLLPRQITKWARVAMAMKAVDAGPLTAGDDPNVLRWARRTSWISH